MMNNPDYILASIASKAGQIDFLNTCEHWIGIILLLFILFTVISFVIYLHNTDEISATVTVIALYSTILLFIALLVLCFIEAYISATLDSLVFSYESMYGSLPIGLI